MLLAIFSTLLAVLLARTFWRRWKYDLHKIPSPPGVPLLGHMPGLVKEGEHSKYRGRWWKKLGCPKMMKFEIAGQTILNITDVEYLKSTVMSKTNPFPRAFITRTGLKPMLGHDYSGKCMTNTVEVTPYVKAMRRVYAIGLQTNTLKAAVPKLHALLDKMIEMIEAKREHEAINVQSLCVKMTLDTIGVVAFDTNLGGLDGSRELYQAIIDVGHYVMMWPLRPFRNLYCKLFPSSVSAKEDRKTLAKLGKEWEKLAAEVLDREDAPPDEEPIWAGLKRFIDPETEKPLTYESLLMETAFVVIAGMDTTGHQLAWILALLAANPDKAEKLVEELKSHGLCGKDARNVTFDDLAELPYLTAVIKEGMRIAHISIGSFFRGVPHDMKILGYRVPAGTRVMFPSTRFMCSEAEWGDPDVFRPERWLTDEDMSNKCCLGFSFGPRDCIGQRLAMMEMRVALIRLIPKYTFSQTVPLSELMNDIQNGIAVEAKNGIFLNVSPKHHVV